MSRYAVKIGEIHLRSDKPITDEERRAAIRQLLKDPAGSIALGDAIGIIAMNEGHPGPDSNLLSMPGVLTDQPAALQPVPEVVHALEDMLEKARTGYVRAIGFGYVRAHNRVSYGWHGVKGSLVRLHLLHSALIIAGTDMGVEIADTSTDVNPDDPQAD